MNQLTNSPFKNEPLKDFSIEENRRGITSALEQLDSTLRAGGLIATPLIGGHSITTGALETRSDPSDIRVVIGKTHFGSSEHAATAVSVCAAGLINWRKRPHAERSAIIHRAGVLMRERANALTALIIREAGKTWREADADVAEAIDFCFYYAQEMLRLGEPQLTERVLGEENFYFYQPRGVVAIISPWNFPLAIACGMTVAALVTGNTAILKPSEQTSLIAHEFAKIVYEAGVPADAFSFLPGRGEDVGRALVQNPHVSMIVFTGSRPVGLEIIRSAATVAPGQAGIKRVVAELGGKNAIIVDEDADFDDAIRGVLQSAFGFAGQKCSACSRLIIVRDAYEPFLERLAAATNDLVVGMAQDPSSFYGPVVDQESHARITGLINASTDLKLLTQGPVPEAIRDTGWYVPPTIFRDVPTNHPVFREEIFGPVIAATRANSFEEALTIANDCEYALTGGVFSRNPTHLELAKREFQVGNLYINRGITGALVCRQPFGGFKFSGVGSKAGGKDYLLQFMEPRTLTENTMRRGFTPDLNS